MSISVDGRHIPIHERRKVRYARRAKKSWPKSSGLTLKMHAVSSPKPIGESGLKFLLKHFDALLPKRYYRPRRKKA